MTNARNLTISATVALLLVAGGGCASDGNDSAATRSTPPSSSTPPTTTSPTPTASEAASAAVSERVRSYFATLDGLRQHPKRPLSDLASVATSIQLSSQRTLLQRERREGLRQVGETKIGDLQVQSVNLDNSDPEGGKVPSVVIDVCWDVSDADLIDDTGTSVVGPNRTDIGWTRFTVANYHWPSNPTNGWRIASGQDLKKTPCAAS